jgi:hypothetical protein
VSKTSKALRAAGSLAFAALMSSLKLLKNIAVLQKINAFTPHGVKAYFNAVPLYFKKAEGFFLFCPVTADIPHLKTRKRTFPTPSCLTCFQPMARLSVTAEEKGTLFPLGIKL